MEVVYATVRRAAAADLGYLDHMRRITDVEYEWVVKDGKVDAKVLKRDNLIYLAITTMDEGSKSICAPVRSMRTSRGCCCNDFRPSSSKPRPNQTRGTGAGKRPHSLRRGGARGASVGAWGSETVMGVAEGPQLPFDPFAKDLEQGDAAATAAATAAVVATQGRQAGAERGGGGDPIGGPRELWYWVPCADGKQFTCLPVRHSSTQEWCQHPDPDRDRDLPRMVRGGHVWPPS